MSCRLALMVLLPLLAAGCGDTAWRDMLPALPRLEQPALAGDEAASPEAGPGLRLALGRRQAHAVLVQQAGTWQLWRTSAGVVVALDGARVVATAGLSPALAATRFEGPDPLAEPRALLDREATARRLLDMMERPGEPGGMQFGMAVECRLGARRAEDQPAILLLEEACRTATGRRFTNRFWADEASGAVLHSEQWIGAGLPLLALTMPVAD